MIDCNGIKPKAEDCQEVFSTKIPVRDDETGNFLTRDEVVEIIRGELGGESFVTTPVGCIDILTDTDIIELRHVNEWQEQLGKILACEYYYPFHRKSVLFFGECHPTFSETVKNVYSRYGVSFERLEDIGRKTKNS
jgi:hypothetical protein